MPSKTMFHSEQHQNKRKPNKHQTANYGNEYSSNAPPGKSFESNQPIIRVEAFVSIITWARTGKESRNRQEILEIDLRFYSKGGHSPK